MLFCLRYLSGKMKSTTWLRACACAAALAGLTGCAGTSGHENAPIDWIATRDYKIAECRLSWRTYVDQAKCALPAFTEFFQGIHFAYGDLAQEFTARYLAINEAADRGELSAAQADARIAEAWFDLNSRTIERAEAARALSLAGRPLPAPPELPAPLSYRCDASGSYTQCHPQ
jgi:hypothetical protein